MFIYLSFIYLLISVADLTNILVGAVFARAQIKMCRPPPKKKKFEQKAVNSNFQRN